MSCSEDHSHFDVNKVIRSIVVLLLGAPITAAAAVALLTDTSAPNQTVVATIKAELVEDCVDFAVSAEDSKLERNAQNSIDETLGADGADYKTLCNWVL